VRATADTNVSTKVATVLASPVVPQPPRRSARPKAARSFTSALATQCAETPAPALVALAWHRSFAAASVPAAIVFSHTHGSRAAPEAGAVSATRRRATKRRRIAARDSRPLPAPSTRMAPRLVTQ